MNRRSLLIVLAVSIFVYSCKEDDTKSCTMCSSPETMDFEVCEEANGNASVNGQDTGTNFEAYISGLEAAGANCGN